MRILLFALFVSTNLLQAHAPNVIHTVDSYDCIYEKLSHLDKDSLIIFDRDDTLLQGIDCIGFEMRNRFIKLWLKTYNVQNNAAALDLLKKIQSHKPLLVDSNVLSLIKELQARQAKVIILTRGCHGKSTVGPLVEDLCIEAFRGVGIDLSQSFEHLSGTILNSIDHNNCSPLFKEGILFSNTCDKGLALEALLLKLKWQPNYIIFVDDKMHYVEEVQRIAMKLNIPFLGLHYRGACNLAKPDLIEQCYKMCYLLERDLV